MVTSNSGEGRNREGKVYTVDNKNKSEKRDFKKGSDNRGKKEGYKTGTHDSRGKKRFGDESSSNRGYNPYAKDNDDEVKRSTRPKSSQKDSSKEQHTDKTMVMNRIEREKKAMMKKSESNRKAKPVKQQVRPKRSNNIDWTREYENGSYDDDDLDMYL